MLTLGKTVCELRVLTRHKIEQWRIREKVALHFVQNCVVFLLERAYVDEQIVDKRTFEYECLRSIKLPQYILVAQQKGQLIQQTAVSQRHTYPFEYQIGGLTRRVQIMLRMMMLIVRESIQT